MIHPIYAIRTGEEKLDDVIWQATLTPRGVEQVREAGKRLRRELSPWKSQELRIIASPATSAVQTAYLLCTGLREFSPKLSVDKYLKNLDDESYTGMASTYCILQHLLNDKHTKKAYSGSLILVSHRLELWREFGRELSPGEYVRASDRWIAEKTK